MTQTRKADYVFNILNEIFKISHKILKTFQKNWFCVDDNIIVYLLACLLAWRKAAQKPSEGLQELKTGNAKRCPPAIEVATVSSEDVLEIFGKSSTKQCYRRFKFCISVRYVLVSFFKSFISIFVVVIAY